MVDRSAWRVTVRRFGALALGLMVAQCSGAQQAEPAASGQTAPPSDCPATRTVKVGQCRGNTQPGYGISPARPLQWGLTAAGGLYFGRLLCPSGALAQSRRINRTGNVWEVRCPDDPATHTWYLSAQCGDPCPPEGFQVIPDEALQHYLQSVRAQENGDLAGAEAQARTAARLAPPNELLTSWLATVLVRMGQLSDAIKLYEFAIRMNPEDPEPKLYLAMAQRVAGHAEVYEAALVDLLAKLPPSHVLVPELQCLQAEVLQTQGRAVQAKALADAACKGGFDGCCKGR